MKILAEKLNAKIWKEGSQYYVNGVPVPPDKFEDRRIVWTTGQIWKAIIIEPSFFGVDIRTPQWRFINLAWVEDELSGPNERPFWEHYLLKNVEFEVIEKNIDQLLSTSVENLEKIKREDLKGSQ